MFFIILGRTSTTKKTATTKHKNSLQTNFFISGNGLDRKDTVFFSVANLRLQIF